MHVRMRRAAAAADAVSDGGSVRGARGGGGGGGGGGSGGGGGGGGGAARSVAFDAPASATGASDSTIAARRAALASFRARVDWRLLNTAAIRAIAAEESRLERLAAGTGGGGGGGGSSDGGDRCVRGAVCYFVM